MVKIYKDDSIVDEFLRSYEELPEPVMPPKPKSFLGEVSAEPSLIKLTAVGMNVAFVVSIVLLILSEYSKGVYGLMLTCMLIYVHCLLLEKRDDQKQ